jgi:flavin reductase (DIM6/NTAB) family NADH-FMN oxidoreductase RutF
MLGGECRATQAAIASKPLVMPARSFLFINVEPPTVLFVF